MMEERYVFPKTSTANQSNYYWFQEGFTAEELVQIEELTTSLDFVQGTTEGGDPDDTSVRNSQIKWVPFSPETKWIYDRLGAYAAEANRELFQFDLSQSTHTVDFNVKQIEVDALLLNFKNSINILIDNPELADEMMIKTKLKEFILLITKSVSAPSQLDFLAAMFKPNHSSLKEVVMNNIYSNLSLDEYAALCHMSTSTFKRQFKETFNSTPKKFINQQKLQKAIQLLGKEELRISDIAYECGFDSLATFNRLFKEEFSKSPTTYKLELN